MSEKNNELDILNEGRRTLAVTFKDGLKGEITVKKVGLVDMPKLAKARRDDMRLLSLYIEADNCEALAERLSDESKLDLLNEGDSVNDPLLNRWLKREEKKLKNLGINLADLHAAVLERASETTSETSFTSSSQPDTAASSNS